MTITKLKVAVAGAVVVAGVSTSLVIQNQARAHQREQDATLRQQSQDMAKLSAENARLSTLLTQTKDDSSGNDLTDLAKLRTESAALQKQTAAMPALREENRKLKARSGTKPPRAKTDLEMKEQSLERINYSRQWQLAFIMYANEHNGAFPANFEQASAFLSPTKKGDSTLTPDEFEIVFQGSHNSIKNPSVTIVLREKEARQAPDGRWAKAYGFADGHAEIHSEPTANFDAYEKERIIPRPTQ